MKKCDFCTASLPNGKCEHGGYLDNPHTRAYYCEKAIERMEKALSFAKEKDNDE